MHAIFAIALGVQRVEMSLSAVIVSTASGQCHKFDEQTVYCENIKACNRTLWKQLRRRLRSVR